MYPLMPPNLAALGVPRRTPNNVADLETIWMTPYPVIGPYIAWCAEVPELTAFGGGDRHQQGERIPGFVTSGYRDVVVEGNTLSTHLMALALDVFVGDARAQVKAGKVATKYFQRVGLYPEKTLIHIDQAPPGWIRRHCKAPYWCYRKGIYIPFDSFEQAAEAALL